MPEKREFIKNDQKIQSMPTIGFHLNKASQFGNSGGPIFKNHGNGTATMLGTVVGGACIIDVNSLHLDTRNSYK